MAQTTNDKIYAAVDNTRKEINTRIDGLEHKIDSSYVTKEEFAPVRNFVFGMIALMAIAIGTAIIALVIKK